MTPAAAFNAIVQGLASDAGLVIVILLILFMGIKKVWVFRREIDRAEAQLTDERIDFMRQLNEMREERDSWRRSSMMLQGQRGPERPPPNPLEGD